MCSWDFQILEFCIYLHIIFLEVFAQFMSKLTQTTDKAHVLLSSFF